MPNGQTTKHERKEVLIEAELGRYPPAFVNRLYTAHIDLPPLNVNSKYRIVLDLMNPHEEDVVFEKAVPNCGCSSVSFERKGFLAGTSTKVIVLLDTPKARYSDGFQVQIPFYSYYSAQQPVGEILLNVALQGNLALPNKKLVFEIFSHDQAVTVPFRYSAPVAINQIEVALSEGLENAVETEIIEADKGVGQLRLRVVDENEDFERLVGSLVLRDQQLEIEAGCAILLIQRPPVVVSPSELRFRKAIPKGEGEVDQNLRTASFLLRINKSVSTENNRIVVADLIRCFHDGRRLSLNSKRLGNSGVFRGEISVQQHVLKGGSEVLEWEVFTDDGRRYSVETFFTLED